jgi:hypothetical protein
MSPRSPRSLERRLLRRLAIVLALSLLGTIGFAQTAIALPGEDCIDYLGNEGCTDSGNGGIDVGVGTGGNDGSGSGGGGGAGRRAFDYSWVPACSGNTPDGLTTFCPGALSSCATTGEARYWVFRRPVDATGRPTAPWTRLPGSACRPIGVGGAPAITAADIAAAFEWTFVPIAPSHTGVNPSSGTLVNADTIFYADTGKTFTTTVRLLGQRVRLRLQPTSWTWHFGDGAAKTTRTPGAPYPSTDVTHRYTKTGRYPASVTVTWDGTFTFAGRTLAIPGDTSRTGPAVTVVVHEARAHLVGG